MNSITPKILAVFIFLHILKDGSIAQNPVIRDQFTADPAARVFNGKVYLFPSHDIMSTEGKGRKGWFCMQDYHVFSSSNLTDWIDHGVIVSQNKVNWVDSTKYSMWAPDCIFRNGKYFFYFPALVKDTIFGKGFAVGVAVADKPEGPYLPQPLPIEGVHGIDPNAFIDKDGQAYLYWAFRKIFVAKLRNNMTELDSTPIVIENLPEKGLIEGPSLFERNDIFYLTYPHVENTIERLEYAIADNPLGPFKYAGVIMDESPSGCWTNQQSIIQFKDQWYIFYHDHDLSPNFDKNRSTRIDSLFFNEDGSIRKVKPTLRGVGLTAASDKINIDRYTNKSDTGSSIAFLDTLDKFDGWKAILERQNAWIQYNAADFGSEEYKMIEIRALSYTGGTLLVKLDNINGTVLAEIDIPKSESWIAVLSPILYNMQGIHNLFVILKKDSPVEIDWIRFIY
jgi:hypothetical protein